MKKYILLSLMLVAATNQTHAGWFSSDEGENVRTERKETAHQAAQKFAIFSFLTSLSFYRSTKAFFSKPLKNENGLKRKAYHFACLAMTMPFLAYFTASTWGAMQQAHKKNNNSPFYEPPINFTKRTIRDLAIETDNMATLSRSTLSSIADFWTKTYNTGADTCKWIKERVGAKKG
ncbi:MAG: hypothetical protein H6679_04690 [Epsilonproteobacteria bacterium]|nr:hypothetical protein [Campylobacterota bacterium]